MTVKELLDSSGVSYTRKNASRIGFEIAKMAKEKGILYSKKPEEIQVNDYPDSFVPEMEEIAIEALKRSVNHG